MSDGAVPKIPKWPFLAGDIALVIVAVWLSRETAPGTWTQLILAGSVAIGAFICIIPFVLEYRRQADLSELQAINAAVERVQGIEKISEQISGATAQWQDVQTHSAKTNDTARQIAEMFTTEARGFADFLRKANDSERTNLRLEVEKLRRAESEWLQVLVRVMDHVYALYSAGAKSGQVHLTEQLSTFQNACRDVARRVGLVPFVAAPGESYNEQIHLNAEEGVAPPPEARVLDTIATGLTYQGQLLRKALVVCQIPGRENPQMQQAELSGIPAETSSEVAQSGE